LEFLHINQFGGQQLTLFREEGEQIDPLGQTLCRDSYTSRFVDFRLCRPMDGSSPGDGKGYRMFLLIRKGDGNSNEIIVSFQDG
jgi:hypothetical protein